MPKMIFVNLPVRDLAAATRFYEAIGCVKNAQFSDEKASSMMLSEEIVFMLLRRDFFETFLTRPLAEATAATGVLLALSRDSRGEVDAIVEAAGKAGGKVDPRPVQDMGFMYQRTFEDPDGHVFEPFWMNPDAGPG